MSLMWVQLATWGCNLIAHKPFAIDQCWNQSSEIRSTQKRHFGEKSLVDISVLLARSYLMLADS